MKLIIQIGLVCSVCWVSQCIARAISFAFPASVIGMVLVLVMLLTGVLRVEQIRETSDFLLSNMAFFFIPAGVNIINHSALLRNAIVQLVVICVVSTLVTFGVTALTVKATLRLLNQRDRTV